MTCKPFKARGVLDMMVRSARGQWCRSSRPENTLRHVHLYEIRTSKTFSSWTHYSMLDGRNVWWLFLQDKKKRPVRCAEIYSRFRMVDKRENGLLATRVVLFATTLRSQLIYMQSLMWTSHPGNRFSLSPVGLGFVPSFTRRETSLRLRDTVLP